ncbi:MAG: T9SS type A sorting domain-containing protein [Bacteroidales bacterium]|nr:T9SS type A sorting domain-containing protein [Bacteroidales bacterium]
MCDLFEISGVRVKRLVNEVKMPGTHEMKIDLRDLKPGIYFCVLRTNGEIRTRKVVKL